MFEGILAGLLTTGLAAVIAAFYKAGYIHGLLDNMMSYVSAPRADEHCFPRRKTTRRQRKFVRHILRDQSAFGHHRGQYGRSCDMRQSLKWQAIGSKESLYLKPRMWLTCWPVNVLHRHGLARWSVRRAVSGVAGLFCDGRIPLYTSAPGPSPTIREEKWNYRHTMAGACLLATVRPNNNITKKVIDLMLDPRNAWQAANGGWWQSNETGGKPGLWASIYAAKLLWIVCATENDVTSQQKAMASDAMDRTIGYFTNEWSANRWSEPRKLSVEENVVAMFIELAPLLSRYAPQLHSECIGTMKQWLSPGGDLSKEYLTTLGSQETPVLEEQAYARMAYAFHLSKDETVDWRRWFEKAARAPGSRLFSTEWAFVLDMSFVEGA